MSTFLLPHLTALLAQLDALADDEHQGRYRGVMFGLETARDQLAQIVADMLRSVPSKTYTGSKEYQTSSPSSRK